jgi:hypothetical protein
MVQVGSGGGFPPLSTGVIVFVLDGAACAAAEIGLAIPTVKAKVMAAVKISFFM